MRRIESNYGKRKSTSRNRINQPYFQSFIASGRATKQRRSLKGLKRGNSKSFRSRSPQNKHSGDIRDLYFKKNFLRSSIKTRGAGKVQYVDLSDLGKFKSARKTSHSKSRRGKFRDSESKLTINHLRKEASRKSIRKSHLGSFRKLDDLSKQLSSARARGDTPKSKLNLFGNRKLSKRHLAGKSPRNDYFAKNSMKQARDEMKRAKLERKLSFKKRSANFIEDKRNSETIGVRTSLMKELDKKIKSIAKTINSINVSSNFQKFQFNFFLG